MNTSFRCLPFACCLLLLYRVCIKLFHLSVLFALHFKKQPWQVSFFWRMHERIHEKKLMLKTHQVSFCQKTLLRAWKLLELDPTHVFLLTQTVNRVRGEILHNTRINRTDTPNVIIEVLNWWWEILQIHSALEILRMHTWLMLMTTSSAVRREFPF